MSKKRVWCWLIAILLLVIGGMLYSRRSNLSESSPQIEIAIKAATSQGTGDAQDKPATKQAWSAKSIGVLVGLTVGGALFLRAVRRKQRSTKNQTQPTSGLGVTVPAPAAAPPPTTSGNNNSGGNKKRWWSIDLDKAAERTKAVLRPIGFVVVICLVLIATAIAKPTWGWDMEKLQNPNVIAIGLVAAALLILALLSKMYKLLGWLLALGLMALIAFLIFDTFNIWPKMGAGVAEWWPKSAPAALTNVDINVSVPGDSRQVRKIVAPVGRLSEETFCIPRGCWYSITATAEAVAIARSGKEYLIGPGHSGHLGDNLKIVDSIISFRATGTKSVVVTCAWEDK